jgi:hypothetical protein
MSNMRGKNWFRFGWHPNEEELLLFLDGEANDRATDKTRAHLEGCWACRNRRDKFDRAIATFMDYCEAESADASTLPPRAQVKFAERLHLAASTQPKPSPLNRLAIRLQGQFAERRWVTVVTACAVLIPALLWMFLRAERPVSAHELLQRTTEAEALTLRRVGDPVVYRKLHVKRIGADETVVWESWRDPQRLQFRQRIADKQGPRFLRADEPAAPMILTELQQVLRASKYDVQRPLSAAAFAEWRSAMQPKTETVTTTADECKLTITTNATARNAIIEAALTVRKSDWHAVALEIKAQGEHDVRTYELREAAYEILPLQALTVFADLAPLVATTSPRLAPTTTPTALALGAVASASPAPSSALPSAVALQEAEVAALFTLHQLQADLGEPIEVVREANRQIIVRGLVETTARKQQLNDALRALPLVSSQLQTVEEAAQKMEQKSAQKTVSPPDNTAETTVTIVTQMDVAASNLPRANSFHQSLEKYFMARGADRRNAALKVAQLSDAIVSEAGAALSEAWALRRLAERFISTEDPEFTAANRQRVSEMMRNHLSRLQAQRRSLYAQVDPMLRPMVTAVAPPAVSNVGNRQTQALQLFKAVEHFAQLSNSLFAGSDGGSDEQSARRILTALAQWDAALLSFAQTISK